MPHGTWLSRGDFGDGGSGVRKKQIIYMLSSLYQHPHGEVPAYEWDFQHQSADVGMGCVGGVPASMPQVAANPTSTLADGSTAVCLTCLTSWLNTQDPPEPYAGGFLGMDNIGCVQS